MIETGQYALVHFLNQFWKASFHTDIDEGVWIEFMVGSAGVEWVARGKMGN